MNIAIIGTGYVGLVSGACFSEMGSNVFCADIDCDKIEKLKKGIIPIYEPGLEPLVRRNYEKGRLHFTTSIEEVVSCADILFLAPGTPPLADGGADLKALWTIVRTIAGCMDGYKLLVIKSTVPVGTAGEIERLIREELGRRKCDIPFDIASNPEFLKEGAAVHDCMYPDRIVIGTSSQKARDLLAQLYHPFTLNGHPVFFMDIASAQMSKYAANSMLATRISFMNEMAAVCEKIGANIHDIRKVMGSDPRIGDQFLYAGTGYGGSCFPKDVKALIHTAAELGYDMQLLNAVEAINIRQKGILYHKLAAHFHNDLQGKTVALWGLSFKPQTDDIREAPSRHLLDLLLKAGVKPRVYDPIAMKNIKALYGDTLYYARDIYDTVTGADALMLVTEWKEFRMPDWEKVKRLMRHPLVLDGRNIYLPDVLLSHGIACYGIGI